MQSGKFLQNALVTALQRYPTLQQRWNIAYARMTNFGGYGFSRNSSDGRIDILLRVIEDEQAARFAAKTTEDPESWLSDLQLTLTRYWLLSSYEMIRLAKNSELGKVNERLQELHRRFELVRIPIGKFEIAKDNTLKEPIFLESFGDGPKFDPQKYERDAKIDYIPISLVNTASGSIGWQVIDLRNKTMAEIIRRELSDEFLAIFASTP